MGELSAIEWCDHTFNPWIGCTKVSAGCSHCYAEALMDTRYGKAKWGDAGTRVRTSAANWRKVLAWNRAAQSGSFQECKVCGKRAVREEKGAGDGCRRMTACPGCGARPETAERVRPRVFCASLADVFEDREDLAMWRLELLWLIALTPALDWLVLTKRPDVARRVLTEGMSVVTLRRLLETLETSAWMPKKGWMPKAAPLIQSGRLHLPNLWLGTSVEDQAAADRRIPELLEYPARVRFLSCEPLLGRVDLTQWRGRGIDWVIVGGESGAGARPCSVEWVRSIVGQCREMRVPVFVKQLGARPICSEREAWESVGMPEDWDVDRRRADVMVPLRMRDSKGGDPAEWPKDLRVREFPV